MIVSIIFITIFADESSFKESLNESLNNPDITTGPKVEECASENCGISSPSSCEEDALSLKDKELISKFIKATFDERMQGKYPPSEMDGRIKKFLKTSLRVKSGSIREDQALYRINSEDLMLKLTDLNAKLLKTSSNLRINPSFRDVEDEKEAVNMYGASAYDAILEQAKINIPYLETIESLGIYFNKDYSLNFDKFKENGKIKLPVDLLNDGWFQVSMGVVFNPQISKELAKEPRIHAIEIGNDHVLLPDNTLLSKKEYDKDIDSKLEKLQQASDKLLEVSAGINNYTTASKSLFNPSDAEFDYEILGDYADEVDRITWDLAQNSGLPRSMINDILKYEQNIINQVQKNNNNFIWKRRWAALGIASSPFVTAKAGQLVATSILPKIVAGQGISAATAKGFLLKGLPTLKNIWMFRMAAEATSIAMSTTSDSYYKGNFLCHLGKYLTEGVTDIYEQFTWQNIVLPLAFGGFGVGGGFALTQKVGIADEEIRSVAKIMLQQKDAEYEKNRVTLGTVPNAIDLLSSSIKLILAGHYAYGNGGLAALKKTTTTASKVLAINTAYKLPTLDYDGDWQILDLEKLLINAGVGVSDLIYSITNSNNFYSKLAAAEAEFAKNYLGRLATANKTSSLIKGSIKSYSPNGQDPSVEFEKKLQQESLAEKVQVIPDDESEVLENIDIQSIKLDNDKIIAGNVFKDMEIGGKFTASLSEYKLVTGKIKVPSKDDIRLEIWSEGVKYKDNDDDMAEAIARKQAFDTNIDFGLQVLTEFNKKSLDNLTKLKVIMAPEILITSDSLETSKLPPTDFMQIYNQLLETIVNELAILLDKESFNLKDKEKTLKKWNDLKSAEGSNADDWNSFVKKLYTYIATDHRKTDDNLTFDNFDKLLEIRKHDRSAFTKKIRQLLSNDYKIVSVMDGPKIKALQVKDTILIDLRQRLN